MGVRCMQLSTQIICHGVRPRLMIMENTSKATGEIAAQNALLTIPASASSPFVGRGRHTRHAQWMVNPVKAYRGVPLRLMIREIT